MGSLAIELIEPASESSAGEERRFETSVPSVRAAKYAGTRWGYPFLLVRYDREFSRYFVREKPRSDGRKDWRELTRDEFERLTRNCKAEVQS